MRQRFLRFAVNPNLCTGYETLYGDTTGEERNEEKGEKGKRGGKTLSEWLVAKPQWLTLIFTGGCDFLKATDGMKAAAFNSLSFTRFDPLRPRTQRVFLRFFLASMDAEACQREISFNLPILSSTLISLIIKEMTKRDWYFLMTTRRVLSIEIIPEQYQSAAKLCSLNIAKTRHEIASRWSSLCSRTIYFSFVL